MPDYCTSEHSSDCQPAHSPQNHRRNYGSNAARQEQLRSVSGSQTQNRAGAALSVVGHFTPINVMDAAYTIQAVEGTVKDIANGKQPAPSDAYSVMLGFSKHFSKLQRLRDQLQEAERNTLSITDGLDGFRVGDGQWSSRDRSIIQARVQRAQQQQDWLRLNQPMLERVAVATQRLEQGLRSLMHLPIYQNLLASAWLDLNMSWVPVTRSLANAAQSLQSVSAETVLNGQAMLRDY